MKVIAATILAITAISMGCQSCGTNITPNIREEPGKEDCPAFCQHMSDLGKTDPTCLDYLLGEQTIDACVEWCVNSQTNSVQLNPGCMTKVSRCDQVDCASRISPSECIDIDTQCK